MTPLDRIEAAEKAATAGPWSVPYDRFDATTGQAGRLATHAEADAVLGDLLRIHAADLIAVAKTSICHRFTVSPCLERPEIPPEDYCPRCTALAPLLREDSE
jgi:hypothetical protein